MSPHHFLPLKIETGRHPHPFQYSVFLFRVLHEFLNYTRQIDMHFVQYLAHFIHMWIKLVLLHFEGVQI